MDDNGRSILAFTLLISGELCLGIWRELEGC